MAYLRSPLPTMARIQKAPCGGAPADSCGGAPADSGGLSAAVVGDQSRAPLIVAGHGGIGRLPTARGGFWGRRPSVMVKTGLEGVQTRPAVGFDLKRPDPPNVTA